MLHFEGRAQPRTQVPELLDHAGDQQVLDGLEANILQLQAVAAFGLGPRMLINLVDLLEQDLVADDLAQVVGQQVGLLGHELLYFQPRQAYRP